MSIVLGLLNGFVSKKFSHGEEVYTIHDSMTSEGMAERMEGNPKCQPTQSLWTRTTKA